MAVFTEAQEPLHLLTVDDYHRMIEVGILTEEDRVELLEGAIIEMTPEGPAHATVVARLTRFVVRGLADDSLLVRVGSPLTLPPHSEPEPDLAVVDLASSNFRQHPHGAHLAIEVSRTSLRKDLARKARVYATARLTEYWVVDLVEMCVHVHTQPAEDAYRSIRVARAPEALQATAVELPSVSLAQLFAAG